MEYTIVWGRTESGDDWHLLFGGSPTHDEVIDAIKSDPWLRDEYNQECIQGWEFISLTPIRNI